MENTKFDFQVVGTTVYKLEFDSYYRGDATYRNRVYANVQGYCDTPKEELEAVAHLFAAAPELLIALKQVARMIKWAEDNSDSPKSALSHFITSAPIINAAIAKAEQALDSNKS